MKRTSFTAISLTRYRGESMGRALLVVVVALTLMVGCTRPVKDLNTVRHPNVPCR